MVLLLHMNRKGLFPGCEGQDHGWKEQTPTVRKRVMNIGNLPLFSYFSNTQSRVATSPTPHSPPSLQHRTPRIHDATALPRTMKPRAARLVMHVPVNEEEEVILHMTAFRCMDFLHQRSHLLVETLTPVVEDLIHLLVLIHETRP